MQPGTTNLERGEITLRSRPAAIVTGLKVEPGSYWSVTARSLTWSGVASPYGVSRAPGADAIDSTPPVRGSICRIVTVSAPVFSSVDCASFSAAAWISMSSASSSRPPLRAASSVIGDSVICVPAAPPDWMKTSCPSLPLSCFS